MRKHILRNALAPTITVISVQIGYLFGGIVGVEKVFNYHGLGSTMLNAVTSHDIPVLQGAVLAGRHHLHDLDAARRRAHRLSQPASTTGDLSMSDSEEFTPEPAEIVSTPGADVYMSSTTISGTAIPPTTPAEIELSGVVQVSERQQARRENWRLIRRRPAFIVGVFIVLVWTICAVLGDRITPHSPLDYRAGTHLSPRAKFPVRHRRTGPRRPVACDGRCPRRPQGCAVGSPARRALRCDRRNVHGLLRPLARQRAGPDRRGLPGPAGDTPRSAGCLHARQLPGGGHRRRGGSVHPGRRPNRAVRGARRTRPRLRHIGQAARRIVGCS